jgi:hypothetical protein
MGFAQLLDIGRDVHRLERLKPLQANSICPAEKVRHRPQVRGAGIGISDIGGEEFYEAAGRLVSSRGDLDRQ